MTCTCSSLSRVAVVPISEPDVNVRPTLAVPKSRKSYSSRADQLFQKPYSRPAPTVQPLRVSEPTAVAVTTPEELIVLVFASLCVQAAPPFTYGSQLFQAYPTRPVAVANQVSLELLMVWVVINGLTEDSSPLMSAQE